MNKMRVLYFFASLIFLCSCSESNAQKTLLQSSALPPCVTSGACSIATCDKPICKQIAQTLVQVEIEPSAFSGSVGQQHFDVSLLELVSEGLELKPTLSVSGTLPKANSEIIAIPINQNDMKSHQAHLSPVDSKGNFAINLVANQEYLLIANPTGRFGLPPTFLRMTTDADPLLDIPLSDKGIRIFGSIKHSAPLSMAELSDKLWIRVMQGDRQVSSLGKLNENGEFSVLLSDPLFDKDLSINPLELVIQPTHELSYIPTKRIPLGVNIDSDIDVGPTDLSPSQSLIPARFAIKSLNNERVREARIIVRSLVPMGYLQSSTTSDENGNGEILLPAGRYDVAVVPRQDDVVGFRKIKDMDFFDSTPLEVRLEQRDLLNSTLFDEKGSPVRGARMLLTRFARADSNAREAILDSAELRLEARSNQDGRWCLLGLSLLAQGCQPVRLDSGRYRLSVIPPEGSQYPYFTQVFDFPEISEINIVLRNAIPLTGRILAPKTKTPVPNSFVRIYSRQLEKESGNPIFLGQAFSRSDGSFSIVIPQEYVLTQTR